METQDRSAPRVSAPFRSGKKSAFVDLRAPHPDEGTVEMFVSPRLAGHWIEHSSFEKQRRLRKHHVESIVNLIEADEWVTGVGRIVFCHVSDSGILHNIDGQHTLHAIVKAGKGVRIDVRSFEAPNEEKRARLFSRFNIGARRSDRDNIGAFGLEDEFDLTKTTLGHVGTAVKFIAAEFDRAAIRNRKGIDSRMNKVKLIEHVREWAPAAEVIKPAFEGVPHETMRSLGIYTQQNFAVVLATARYCPELAREFWEGVVWMVNVGKEDPRRALHQKLRKYTTARGSNSQHRASAEKMSRWCAAAWNKYYDQEQCRLLVVRDEKATMHLKGTPFTND